MKNQTQNQNWNHIFEKTLKSRIIKRLAIVSSLGSLELGLAFKTRIETKTNLFFP